ncbi:MAG: CapA family protein [Thermoclostridium sp.]|nr:CapA family protein [Thermoclostridium sp.]
MTNLQVKPEDGRISYWDNLKGILIFLVVLGHYLWTYLGFGMAGGLVSFIYIFHMPAFIMISGFLSKSERSRSKQSLIRLAVIYVVFNIALMLLSALMFKSTFQLLTPSYSAWFLLSLIVWRAVIKYVPESKLFIIVCIIAAILVGWWKDVTNVLAIARTIVFFPFFYIGYKLPAEKFMHFIQHRKSRDYLIGGLIFSYGLFLSVLFLQKFPWLKQSDFLMDSYGSFRDMFARVALISLAGMLIAGLFMLVPAKPLPLLVKWGKNSIAVYVLHRFFTFLFMKAFPAASYSDQYLIPAFGAAILTTLILGSDFVAGLLNQFIDGATKFLTFRARDGIKPAKPLRAVTLSLIVLLFLMLPLYSIKQPALQETAETQPVSEDVIHPVMTEEQKSALQNTVTLAFVGDLILLQDQVRNAYNAQTGEYDFTPTFQYANKYLTQADLAIGIFEGPMAGEEAGYTTSNFDDGIPLYLNFPDAFAAVVKESGIDLVSTANNHLLDKGEKGAMRTLDALEQMGLQHVGSWRNEGEKASIPVIDVKGIRIAFLAYTYGSNYTHKGYFLHENPSLTSILTDPSSPDFDQVKSAVLADFERIKTMENPPDLIAVIPHMGTQFSHETDNYQDTWNSIFIEAGADIILGDHAHAVQPIEFRSKTGDAAGKNAVIVNCPGNFANSYIEHDGDATAIVEIHLEPVKKEVLCAGVIPMYTHARSDGNYRALPVHTILNDPVLQREVSQYELRRVSEVFRIITQVMLGTPLTLDQAREKHYLFPEGYFRQTAAPIKVISEMKNTAFYQLLEKSDSVCFVGDSITAGSKNGGFGWYEPMMAAFPGSTVFKQAWGSATTMTLLDHSDEISGCSTDLFVIAIGTNDVRYRDENICALDSESFIENINTLVFNIKQSNPGAEFAFIAPWLALDNDPFTKIDVDERDALLKEYGQALKDYCSKNAHVFINPNPAIAEVLTRYAPSGYLLDHIHPNANRGITLYSEKVLTGE